MPFINIDSGLGFAAGYLVAQFGVPWVVAKVKAPIAAGYLVARFGVPWVVAKVKAPIADVKADITAAEGGVAGILPKTVAELKALEAEIAKKL